MKLLLCMLMTGLLVTGWAEDDTQGNVGANQQGVAREILVGAVRHLLQTESGRKYFGSVDPKNLMITEKVEARSDIPIGDGWIVLWRYQQGELQPMANPVKESQFGIIPGFADDRGIFCEIFIAYRNGIFNGSRVRFTTRGVRLPDVDLAYYLIKKSEDKQLNEELYAVCREMKDRLEARLAGK